MLPRKWCLRLRQAPLREKEFPSIPQHQQGHAANPAPVRRTRRKPSDVGKREQEETEPQHQCEARELERPIGMLFGHVQGRPNQWIGQPRPPGGSPEVHGPSDKQLPSIRSVDEGQEEGKAIEQDGESDPYRDLSLANVAMGFHEYFPGGVGVLWSPNRPWIAMGNTLSLLSGPFFR